MNKLRFGPSGNSESFYQDGNKSSVDAPRWLKQMGLSCYEYSFGRGFTMSEDKAIAIGEQAKINDILVSVHAPYYINFANTDDLMIEKSIGYVLKSLRFCELFGGKKIVVHPASCGKLSRENALGLCKQNLANLANIIKKSQYTDKLICLETMGKYAQIGTYEEIIDLCLIDEIFVPTFDFGHINCILNGDLKTKDDYKKIFDLSIQKLGFERTSNCHIHFSKIEYGVNGGEIKHLTMDDTIYGPEFEPLAEVLYEYNLKPTIICESKTNMAEDALKMKSIYYKIVDNKI